MTSVSLTRAHRTSRNEKDREMLKKSVYTFLYTALVCNAALAQHNYSIPAGNWTYSAIQELQTRGYLLDLSPGFKPYRRMEVAEALDHLRNETGHKILPAVDRWLIDKLDHEFAYEMKLLRAKRARPDTALTGARISEEDYLNFVNGYYGPFKYADKPEFRPILTIGFGFDVGNHLALYTDATVNQTLRDDSIYTGSTKFGIDALAQQAYIQYSNRYFDLMFGRDYLSWGFGDNGETLVSTTPGPLDMVSLFIKTDLVKFNWFVAQLNPMPEFTPDTNSYMPFPTAGVPDPSANRYFTGSRAEFNVLNKFFLGIYQAAIFGGPNASINLISTNPMRVNFESTVNDHLESTTNNFLGADLSVFWPKDINLYGDLMIDDWQVDRKSKGDLKPDLYAIQAGMRAADILFSTFGISGTDLSLQYMMAGNRVYNEYNWASFLKLLSYNYPIASPFGDDFWNVELKLSQWISSDWKVGIEGMHIKHGSTNIASPYTMPWLTDPNITVQTGYREPFPYGVIQETSLFSLDAMYQPVNNVYVGVSLIYSHERNANYDPGLVKNQISFILTFYYRFSNSFLFN